MKTGAVPHAGQRKRDLKWEIRVGKKDTIIEQFSVPIYKLDGPALKYFLVSSVARLQCESLQDTLDYFVNGRKGMPQRSPYAQIFCVTDPELGVSGYFCGTWECYAEATFLLSDSEIMGLKRIIRQNKE
jgi:hypothetical protein